RPGWSLVAGLVFALGMLIKPPFAVYVLVPVLLVAASSRHRRRGAVYAALALLIGAALSLPWYGPRLFGLVPQIANRSFKQAAESGHPDPLTATALLLYPTWVMTQLGILAVVLLLVGLGVAAVRRQWIALAALFAPFFAFALLQNKNLRYTLPLLPIAAVFAGMAFGLVPGRMRALGGMVLALACAIQVSATALGVPKSFTLPGLGVPFVLESPPRPADWRHRDIMALIGKDSRGLPVPVSGEFRLPDGSTATLRARRLTDSVAVEPAVFAREVQAAVRRALADVAADVQGLDIALSYDETLLRGHIGRVDIRAAVARLGEIKRPGSPLLRVADVRIVFEDVLVNPFSVHSTGRLSPLDAQRAALEQATIREADLQAFL